MKGQVQPLDAEDAAASDPGIKKGLEQNGATDVEAAFPFKVQTAWEMFDDKTRRFQIGLGCPILDKFLDGGLRQGVHEISGEAGCGKTQIAYQLLLQAQVTADLGGLDGAAVYISTEGEVPVQRIRQIMRDYECMHPRNYMDHIFIKTVYQLQDQTDFLYNKLPSLVESQGVRLVVIDSIASLFRGHTEYQDRARMLMQLSAHLSKMAEEYRLVIVCINQVTDVFETSPEWATSWHGCVRSMGRRVKPALGLTWSHCVHSRILLAKHQIGVDTVQRLMHVIFSPYQDTGTVPFCITDKGVRGIKPDR